MKFLFTHYSIVQCIIGIMLAGGVAFGSHYFRFLTTSGSIATFFLAAIIFGLGGLQWSVPVLTFFILSSFLSKSGKKRKSEFELMFEKTDTRDAGQVFANGGVAGIVIVCSYFFLEYRQWYSVYLASLAAVTADTWGTEIGLMSKSSPRSVMTFKKTQTGASGAVSIAGLAGGALGASLIALSGSFWMKGDAVISSLTMIVIAGVFGSLVDSAFGATIQAKYQCVVCGKMTERIVHCQSPAVLVDGIRWIGNDVVNWACAIAGSLFFVLLTAAELKF